MEADKPALDGPGFADLFEAHRRELRAHCYRMAGALGEAEDLVQETFLRAWRSRSGFEGRSTARAWLFRIATNACLDALAGRHRRVLPCDVVSAADGLQSPVQVRAAWLEPCPEHLLDPADDAVARETLELTFLATIQHLSPRQRAAFLLRDVLGWTAAETADALEVSVTAVKSSLQRARATLRDRLPRQREQWTNGGAVSHDERAVLRRYVEAHRHGDRQSLADLLAEELRAQFPPLPLWIEGREPYLDGIRRHADPGVYQWVETAANHQPAVAVYLRAPGAQRFRLRSVQVLNVIGGRIAGIVDFHDVHVLDSFSPAVPSELA
ncbi:RNA polymerase subunit sigma-70 [Plantactinospora sp. GCM10030261]|uniref:RNA polymerase subunit sigma-70 n=1 Tax=Plantactinospora sp. GCM10030261 TaxID=3273420 RepID=UPI00361372BC